MSPRQHSSFLSEPLSATEILATIQQGKSLAQSNLAGINLSQMDLFGIDLSGSNLIGANLSQTNLQGANLQGVDLRRANLRDANLSGANLQESYLFRADLQGCNLVDAQLQEAKLKLAQYDAHTLWPEGFNYKNSGAIGPQANLSGAFLNTAYLRGADLQGADLTGANLEQLKSIAGADFTLAQGLTQEMKAMLRSRDRKELGTWNAFTRNNTAQSLGSQVG